MKSLPIIDILKKPYLAKNCQAHQAITTHFGLVHAAFFDSNVRGEIEMVIETLLDCDADYTSAKQQMPSPLPHVLNSYSTSPKVSLAALVDKAINNLGIVLTEGQVVYHGSTDEPRVIFTAPVTSRPLSTSLSPKVAINECFHRGKAFRDERYVIYILTVKDPSTNVFAFPEIGSPVELPDDAPLNSSKTFEMNEQEILFASGACVIIDTEKKIGESSAFDHLGNSKEVPVYICTGTIS